MPKKKIVLTKPKAQGRVAEKQKEIIKNLGNTRSMTKAAEDAGYSPSYAKSGQIQQSATWQELMEKHISDEKLAKVHDEGLLATKVIHSTEDGRISDMVEVPDHATRAKFADMGYKLKKRYDNTIHIRGAIGQLSDEALEEAIAERVSGIISAIAGTASKKGK